MDVDELKALFISMIRGKASDEFIEWAAQCMLIGYESGTCDQDIVDEIEAAKGGGTCT